MKNHYDILGITEGASQEEIKKAYRKLSMKFHPDKNENDPYFSDLFKRITEAYETLGDAERRANYDAALSATSTTNSLEDVHTNSSVNHHESTPEYDFNNQFYEEHKKAARSYEDEVVKNENKRKRKKRITRRIIILFVFGWLAFYLKDEISDIATDIKIRYFNTATLRGTVISTEGLNMRNKPNTRSRVIYTLPAESRVLIIDENGPAQTIDGMTANWFMILYNEKEGWVWGGYISKD